MRVDGTDSKIAGLDKTRLVTEIEDIKGNGTGSRFFVDTRLDVKQKMTMTLKP